MAEQTIFGGVNVFLWMTQKKPWSPKKDSGVVLNLGGWS